MDIFQVSVNLQIGFCMLKMQNHFREYPAIRSFCRCAPPKTRARTHFFLVKKRTLFY